MSEPSTGGAITSGSRGYSGKSSGSGSSSSNNNNSAKSDVLDLNSFTIESNLDDYEGTEMSSQDILALGKGPLNPDLFTKEGREKIQQQIAEKQYQNEVRTSMSRMGYNDTDIQRVLNGEITQEDLYNEIFQEYLSGDTSRMEKLLEASVINEGFYYSREETIATRNQYQEQIEFIKGPDFQTKLDSLQSDYDMYTQIANGCREVAANNGEYYVYTNLAGEEVQIPVDKADYFEDLASSTKSQLEYLKSLQDSVGEMEAEISSMDEMLADPNKKEFKYTSVEQMDTRLSELDEQIKEKREAIRMKAYGYDIPDEKYKDPEFLKTYLDEQPITAWRGVAKEGVDTKGWSIFKIGEDKYVMMTGTGKNDKHIDLDGNPSYGSFTAQELIDAGYVITPVHWYDPKRVSAEDQAELDALLAEQKELKEIKSTVEAYTDYYVRYGKYLLKSDFVEKSQPISREKLTINNTGIVWGWEGPLYGNLFEKMSEILGHPVSLPEDAYNTEEPNDNEDILGYLLYDELSMGSTDNPLYHHYVGALFREGGEAGDDIHAITFHQEDLYESYATKWSSVMNATEKAIFFYICNTEGYAAGFRYLDEIAPTLDERYKNTEYEKESKWATACFGNSLWASVRSIFLKPVEGLQAMAYSLTAVRNDGKIFKSNIISRSDWDRGAIGEKIGEFSKALSFLYGLGMSMGDSAVIIGLTVASGGSFGTVYTALLIGPSVYVSTLNDALDRNFSDKEAVGMAILFSAVEVAMESYSLSHLIHADANITEMLKRFPKLAEKIGKLPITSQRQVFALYTILSQSFVEMDEEVWTTILDRGIDWAAEKISATGKSQFTVDYETYKSLHPNCSDDEAYSFAYGQFFHGLVLDAAGGAISGGIFGKISAVKMFGFKSSNRSANVNNNTNTNNKGIQIPAKPNLEIKIGQNNNNNNNNTNISADINNNNNNNNNNNTETDTKTPTVTSIKVEQVDTYIADGDLNTLIELAAKENNVQLNNTINSKLVEYVSSLDTNQLSALVQRTDLSPEAVKAVVTAITQAYKSDGTGYNANVRQILNDLISKSPAMKSFYDSVVATEQGWYEVDQGMTDRMETWMLMQYMQAQKLANNPKVDLLNTINSAFAANGDSRVFTSPIDAYFATLEMCADVRAQIKALEKQKAWGKNLSAEQIAHNQSIQQQIDQIYKQYEWLANLTDDIAARNGHDPSTVGTVSFFQASNTCYVLQGSVGRPNTTSFFDGGTACCNVAEVDTWIMQEMETIMAEHPDADAAEIEKLFIKGYFDYAALQGFSYWEAAYYRAVATNIQTGDLARTNGLQNSVFKLEWCLGGETLGMNEEFMLRHSSITESDRANLGPLTTVPATIYDAAGNKIGEYQVTYCTGLKDIMIEMYNSGRITDPVELGNLAKWYETVYGTPIPTK